VAGQVAVAALTSGSQYRYLVTFCANHFGSDSLVFLPNPFVLGDKLFDIGADGASSDFRPIYVDDRRAKR
jgi:hypothetical protein